MFVCVFVCINMFGGRPMLALREEGVRNNTSFYSKSKQSTSMMDLND